LEQLLFMLLAKKGQNEVVEYLLEKGADLNRQKFKTPFHLACEKGHLSLVQLLIEKGVDVNKPVIFRDNFNEKELENLPPGFKHEPGTPLQLAAEEGHEEVVRLLLSKGAKVNQTTRANRTALHFAVENQQLLIIKLLLKKGANIKIKSFGKTATHIAKERGYVDAVKMLEKAKLRPKNWV